MPSNALIVSLCLKQHWHTMEVPHPKNVSEDGKLLLLLLRFSKNQETTTEPPFSSFQYAVSIPEGMLSFYLLLSAFSQVLRKQLTCLMRTVL